MPRWLEQWIIGAGIAIFYLSLCGVWWVDWVMNTYGPKFVWAAACLALAIGGAWALFDDSSQRR
jgi:hypothetical protein